MIGVLTQDRNPISATKAYVIPLWIQEVIRDLKVEYGKRPVSGQNKNNIKGAK